jgi:hypothetical protein
LNRYLALVLGLGLTLVLLVAACGDDDDDSKAEAPDDDDVLAAVTQALLDKNGWDPADVEITLGRVEDGRFATGGVRDVPPAGGGLWFAALVDGEWRIVWDGNGAIDCPSLEPYPDFPASLIAECYDPSDGSVTQR